VAFIEKVGIIGAGAMGSAIAEVMALNGKKVVIKDINEEAVQRGLKTIDGILNDLVTFHEGKAEAEIRRIEDGNGITLTEEQKAAIREAKKATYTRERAARIRANIKGTTSYDDFQDVDLVIEAAVERMDLKKAIFKELDNVVPRHVIFATNTSALPITELSSAVSPSRRQRFLGMHFFNPPYTLPLIEVIPALDTNPGIVEETIQFLEELRNHRFPMQPIKVKECPGFVVNRILGRVFPEAANILEEGIASARDIDKAMKAGAGWPMGPFELADMVGIDVIYHVAKNMKDMGVSETQRKPLIMDQLYHAGRLGKKSGRGFYDYTATEE